MEYNTVCPIYLIGISLSSFGHVCKCLFLSYIYGSTNFKHCNKLSSPQGQRVIVIEANNPKINIYL